jgi:hypothetical protein
MFINDYDVVGICPSHVIRVAKEPTETNLADPLTKQLGAPQRTELLTSGCISPGFILAMLQAICAHSHLTA